MMGPRPSGSHEAQRRPLLVTDTLPGFARYVRDNRLADVLDAVVQDPGPAREAVRSATLAYLDALVAGRAPEPERLTRALVERKRALMRCVGAYTQDPALILAIGDQLDAHVAAAEVEGPP